MTIKRIVGIDPGSRLMGYGIIQIEGNRYTHIASGVVNTGKASPAEKLQTIYRELKEILSQYTPTHAAIEQVFMQHNVRSALVLGQARGAALVALSEQGLAVSEFTARQVKKAVVGYGNADKKQVQHMVRCLLNLQHTPTTDAADALAIALCHANTRPDLNFSKTR